jgi:hypothetical protein
VMHIKARGGSSVVRGTEAQKQQGKGKRKG